MAVVISDRLLESSDRLLDAEPDEQLVSLVQAGHDAAFAAIVRRYERELQAQASRLTSDGRGEDAVQQAFLNAFAALRADREVRHLRGWLHQILRNEVTRARVPVDAPLEAATAYGETLEDTVQRRATARATLAQLSALPDRQRDALLGTAVLGFPRAHVAHTMGLSEGAVRQLVHRARVRLRQAATALVPFPLVRFFGAARSSVDAAPDAALGAGTAVSGGLVIKVGALLASGVVATGIAVTHTFPPRHPAPSQARGARHHRAPAQAPARVPVTSAPSRAPGDAASAINSVRLREHGPAGARADGGSQGGPGRLSGARSGRHDGPGSGRGGAGRDGSPSERGGGSGGSQRGTSGHGGEGSGSSSGEGSGSSSGSSGSGSGDKGSGSGSGDSGSRSGSMTGSSGSGSGDGAASSDGGHGSGHSGSDGGSGSSLDGDATAAATSGSSGSTPSVPATAAGEVTSGDDGGGSSGGQSSGGQSSSDGGSGGGSGSGDRENSSGSRDVSGSLDSSPS